MPLDILLGRIGKVSDSNTSVLIALLTYSPSSNNIYLFAPAVLIIYNYIALNTSRLTTYIVRVLSLLWIVAALLDILVWDS